MAHNETLRMQPTEVAESTRQLDELADRIQQLMQTEGPNLMVSDAARDEVSQRVASTLNEVHDTFAGATDQGTSQIREVAATLRAQTTDVAALDGGFIA